jgi:enamine deaminase RidA (YjgF/YER057c/UK114 family)
MSVFLLLLPVCLTAQSVEHLQPDGLSKPTGYSHVVTVSGKLAFISGQVANDANGNLVGKGDLRAQTVQVFENLKKALAAAGASFEDVVKMNTYIVGMRSSIDLPVLREIRARYVTGKPPASTLVGVQALANPDYLIEIEVVAAVK